MQELQNIIKFIELTHQFQAVERRVLVKGTDRYENDVEHCYQLAMLAWYIVDSEKLSLNKDLVMKYGMIHDLVEAYAGDTYIYEKDLSILNSKVEREAQAAQRLREEFPEFGELHQIIDDYEHRVDEESKFIYALDKIIPMLNIYLDGGETWQREEVSLQDLIDYKTDKVATSLQVQKYFEHLIGILKDQEAELFNFKKDEKV